MKSEHRHELQTNELGKVVERLGTFMEVHGNRLMIGVFVVGLAVAVALVWRKHENAKRSAAWQSFEIATRFNTPDEYQDVWTKYKGMPAGLWAKVHEGERRLDLGVQSMFRNVEKGASELEKSRDAFQAVLDDRNAPPEIRERALIGLGHALESLSSGSEGDAVKSYESLLKEFPDSIYKEDAQQRLAGLKREGETFYTWFSKYPRPKLAEKLPHDKGGAASEDELKKQFEELSSELKSRLRKGDADNESLELPDSDQRGSEQKSPPADAEEPEKKSDEGADSSNAAPEKKPASDSQPESDDESKDSE